MRRLIVVALLLAACRRGESPTEPRQPGNIMGSMGDASLAGQVVSAGERPVEGAIIVIHRDSVSYSARTDASGNFAIGGYQIWHGLYALDVYVATQAEPFTTIVVDIKRLENYVRIKLPPGSLPSPGCGYLNGYVTEYQSRQPLAGVQVSVLAMRTVTSADGFYLFEFGCPPTADPNARYSVHFEDPSHIPFNFDIRIGPSPQRLDAQLIRLPI